MLSISENQGKDDFTFLQGDQMSDFLDLHDQVLFERKIERAACKGIIKRQSKKNATNKKKKTKKKD